MFRAIVPSGQAAIAVVAASSITSRVGCRPSSSRACRSRHCHPLPQQGEGLSLDAASVLEDLDVVPVLMTLKQLAERPEGRANSGAVEAVVAGYKQLAAL